MGQYLFVKSPHKLSTDVDVVTSAEIEFQIGETRPKDMWVRTWVRAL